ncbi:MAG: GTP 3',8-cyclase MoaA [Clostridia bacterium]|nr:GTP 3',8-cyclase MoaA [Clostridia bacterium]
MLTDRYGRTISYMRISVTDRCNLRCRYCMPDGIERIPMSDLLTYEEIAFVCRQAADLGIGSFRITGGEPLVRKGCVRLVSMLKETPGVRRVTMTTNGVLLGEHLNGLLDAGLDAVNISLDTLDRGQYKAITGMDELDRVLASIRRAAGKLPVRINCVICREINDDAPGELATLARDLPVDVRFIELMPIGAAKGLETVPNASVLARIEEQYGKTTESPGGDGDGPAVYRRADGFTGRIGFISAMHGKFCAACNRLRLTSVGELKPCLCYADTVPLREILRDGAADKEERIREKIREAVRLKPQAHCFERRENVTEEKEMVRIGG